MRGRRVTAGERRPSQQPRRKRVADPTSAARFLPYGAGSSLRSIQSTSRARGLGQADQIEELGTVAEQILASGRSGQRNHFIVAEGLEIRVASQQLPERGDCNREAHLRGGLV